MRDYSKKKAVEVLVKGIKDSVKTKLLTVRVKKSLKAQINAIKWGLKWNDKGVFDAC